MTCDHNEITWDWGAARPSEGQVIIPGYCDQPDCSVGFERVYEFVEITEA